MDLQQKKSEQSNNERSVLNLSAHNTKTRLQSLGDVELKYISGGDAIEFEKLLEKQLPEKDFVSQILFHQLVKPKTDFNELHKISDKELEELARAFIKNEDHSFKYFQDTGDFFKDFKQAFTIGYEKDIEEIRETFEPIIRSTQETLKAFSNNYASVIQQTLDGTSYIKESLQTFANFAEQVGDTHRRFVEYIKPAIQQYQSTAKIITESLRPQIDYWKKWAEENKKTFDSFSNYWTDFHQKYNIAE